MIMKKFLLFCCSLFAASSFAASNGTICLTFDDRYFASWEKSIPFFEKYDASTTDVFDGVLVKHSFLQDCVNETGV